MIEFERILAKTVMDLIVSIDLTDDDDIDPDRQPTALDLPVALGLI